MTEPGIGGVHDEILGGVGAAAALVLLTRDVDLNHHLGAWRSLGDLGGELGPINGLPNVDMWSEKPNLVALESADEVHRWCRGDLGELGSRLLGVVLADVVEPGCDSGVDGRRTKGLGDRHDADIGSTFSIEAARTAAARSATTAGSTGVMRSPAELQ